MAVTTLVVLLLSGTPTFACSCSSYPTLCESVTSARAVFIGTVLTGTEPDDGQEHRGFGQSIATVRVETIVRGLPDGTTQISVNPSVGTSCYFPLKKGERHLLVGSVFERLGTFITGVCHGGAQLLPGSTRVERIVQSFLTGPNLLLGTVRRYQGWDSRYRSDNLIAGAEVSLTPVAGAAGGSSGSALRPWSSTTSENGTFEVSGLPPGEYRFQVIVPGLAADPRSEDDKDKYRDRVPPIVRLPERGCVDIPVMMWPDQSISGTVTGADGKPVSGITVHACSIDSKDGSHRSEREAKTDAAGRYVLPRLAQGTYIVGVNVSRLEDSEPYRMTFHPAATRAQAAARIQMNGTSVEDVDLQLPRAREKTQVKVRVVSATGEPVRGALVPVWRDDKGNDSQSSSGLTDRAGEIALQLWDGDEYTIYAITFDENAMRPIRVGQPAPPIDFRKPPPGYRSPNLRIVATPGRTVTLKLPEKPNQ